MGNAREAMGAAKRRWRLGSEGRRRVVKVSSSGGKGHSNPALVELDPKFRKLVEHMDACCAQNRGVCDTEKCDRWFDGYVDARGVEVDWEHCMEEFNDRRPGWTVLEVSNGDTRRGRGGRRRE